MKHLYRFFLIFGLVLALALVPTLPLRSQTPPPTVAPAPATTSKVAASGIYTPTACSIVAAPLEDPNAPAPNGEPSAVGSAPLGLKGIINVSPFSDNAQEGTDYECGYLTVPELHSQPDGKTIQVAIAILKSTNPNPAEPLILFQGGPGGSSFDIFPILYASPDSEDGRKLRADRDLIVFEKRGNRYSQPWLSCNQEMALGEPDDLKVVQACRDRLVSEGVNLVAFNSVESAHDVAALVKALGYDQVNLYGVSYGTELVQNIMREHPDIIRSVILDGIVAPDINVDEEYAIALDRLINTVDAACAADSDCNALYPDVRGSFDAAFNRLNQTPATIKVFDFETSGIKVKTLKGNDLANSLFTMAYNTGAPFLMPALVYQINQGDYSLLTQYSYFEGLNTLIANSSADGTYFSVKCSEDMAYAKSLALTTDTSEAAKTWGTESFQEMVDSCKIWNVPALAPSARQPVVSDIPALLFNGAFDPITPPPYGEAVAKGLSNSTFVEFPANGHGAIAAGSCAATIMTAFLNNPDQPPDTTCAREKQVVFITDKNTLIAPGAAWLAESVIGLQFGEIAKRLFLLVLLMGFPVVWLILMWIHRLTHKDAAKAATTAGQRWSPWVGVLLAVLSALWIGLQLTEVVATTFLGGYGPFGYTRIFVGVDRSFAWVFVIPILIAVLSVVMAVLAVLSWKHHYWGTVRRVFYSLTAGVAIAYTLFLAKAGQLTVFF